MKHKVLLKNGLEIESDDEGRFKPLREICSFNYACDLCPDLIKNPCSFNENTGISEKGGNNEFDCSVYGMFDGFYCGVRFFLTPKK
jgi:hypothetical protein